MPTNPSTATPTRPHLPPMASSALTPFYDTFTRVLGVREMHWRLLVQAGIEPGQTVLEIGCGTGNLAMLAAEAEPGATVHGIDPDADALRIAERKAARAGGGVTFGHGFADRLPFADGSVDRVLSSLMLHHVPADERVAALREARRVLAPGGRLHLVDIDSGEPPALARLLFRAHGHRPHDHDQQGHGHGHGHGHGPGVGEMLVAAGFTGVTDLGPGRSAITHHTFWRAESS